MQNKTVLSYYGLGEVDGEVGIEIEVEGHDLPDAPKGWRREHDGSLRGESAEYVLREPIDREDVQEYLHRITGAYKGNGSVINDSYRTSTHVHLNVQYFTFTQVYNVLTLYYMFEEYLVKHCGDNRVGNLFCLRLTDAEGVVPILREAAIKGSYNNLLTERIRYAAVNLNALGKYGSLEFRSMRGTENMKDIETWVNLLLRIKDAALEYDDPTQIVDEISQLGAKGLAEKVFGDLLQTLPLDDLWEEVVFKNMRAIQTIAYAIDWETHTVNKKEFRFKKIDWQVPQDLGA